MTTARAVAIHPRTMEAHGLSPRDITHALPGTAIVLPDGTTWRVTDSGALDPVAPFGFRSIAADPSAARGSRA